MPKIEERPLAELLAPAAWLVVGVAVNALVANRFNVAALGWVAAVPWLVYLRRTDGWKSRLALLLAMQLAVGLQVGKIVTEPLSWFFVPMFSVPMALGSGLLTLAFEWLRRQLGDGWGLVLFPAITVAGEWITWSTSEMGSWGVTAYTQLDNPALMQSVSLFGLAAVSLQLAAVSALIAVLISDPRPRRWLAAAAIVGGIVTAALVYGTARLENPPEGELHTVAAVVTDVGPTAAGLPSDAELAEAEDTLFARSELAAERGAELIVWNEGATAVAPEREQALLDRGLALSRDRGVDLVVAYVVPLDGMARFENKYVWLTPDGIAESYLKNHPVPGEGSVRGTDPIAVLHRPYGAVAGAICYDYDFPALGMQHARNDAGLVVVPSSDWRGIDPVHTKMAYVRGIEGGFSVLRSVRWATSGAFDAHGRARATMSWFADDERVMLARVPVDRIPTLYSQVGDVLPWTCTGVVLLGLGVALRRRRRTAPSLVA